MNQFNIIVSVTQNNIIGANNDLLISSADDLKNFYKITTYQYPEGPLNNLIMGYNTWESLPKDKKPLKKRMNLIITKNHKDEIDESEFVKVFSDLQSCVEWCNQNTNGRNFIIGGESIFKQCIDIIHINTIYMTKFMDDYRFAFLQLKEDNVKFFPHELLNNLDLVKKENHLLDCNVYDKSGLYQEKIDTRFHTYQSQNDINQGEYQYLNILKKIMKDGIHGHTRNGKTRSLFGERMEFDMKDGFPLLTTKKMGYKTILRELLWFISGSTSNHKLNEKNVHIWDLNSTREFLDSQGLDYEEGDLGPVYGFQWRHSGAEYKDCHTDYTGQGIDQLQNVIDLIKDDPHSRRIIMNSWNPNDLNKMALPPCHVMCQFHVNTEIGTLDCQLYQRSGDMFLGVPFNIASYSFLLHMIADLTRYKPGKLIHILGDTHIYENHFDAVRKQLERVPVEFPKLEIIEDLSIKKIDDITEEMFSIKHYKSYDKISAPMIA